MKVQKSKKHHSFDGRYSEADTKELFRAIAVGNRESISDLLDSDRSLIGTPYEVRYEKYSDFLDTYIMKTEEMLPIKWATIIGDPDIINLLKTYETEDGRDRSKRVRKSSLRTKKSSRRTKKSSRRTKKASRRSKKSSRRSKKSSRRSKKHRSS